MQIGNKVRVVNCDSCPKVVGKIATVVAITANIVELKFGRGRPQLSRPTTYNIGDLRLVE